MPSSSAPAPSGWTPDNEGGDDVGSNHHTFVSPINLTGPLGSDSPSTFSTFHVENDPESDGETRRRLRQNHIPRPSNAFMLFRSHFSKNYALTHPKSLRAKSDATPPAGYISKLASEAWKALSKEERAYWDGLCEKEKEEHARRYPGYSYRPVKRAASERRARRPRSSARDTTVSRRRLGRNAAASSSAVTLTSTWPEPSRSTNATPVPDSPSSTSASLYTPQVEEPLSRRALHRRSISVPIFPNLPPVVDEEPSFTDRASRRRSRSITAITDGRSYFADYAFPEPLSSNFMSFQAPGSYYDPVHPSEHAWYDADLTPGHTVPPADGAAYRVSPLAAVASSLAGWNGQPIPPAPATVTPSQTWSSPSPETSHSRAFYDQAYPGQQEQEVPWSTPQSFFNPDASQDPYGLGFYNSMESLDPSIEARALEQYDVGLNEQVLARAAPSYLPFGLYPDDESAPRFR